MPYKELGTEQEITGTTAEEKAASRKALGFPDGVAVEKTQLMFNDDLPYVVGMPDPDPIKSNLLAPNFSIDHVIKSILTEVSPDKATLQESGLKKSYLVPSANAFWLGAFNLPEHSENLKQELTKAKALKSPEKEEHDSIVFLVCTQPDNIYEFCELFPDKNDPKEWELFTTNTAGEQWNTENYEAEKDTKPNERLNQIKSVVESQSFKLSNITTSCRLQQSSPSGSAVAAIETVTERLFVNPYRIFNTDSVKMSDKFNSDIPAKPGEVQSQVTIEECARLRHAAILMKAVSRDNNKALLTGIQQELKKIDLNDDKNNTLPVYLAGLNSAGNVASKIPAPATCMDVYYQAYLKDLKAFKLDSLKKIRKANANPPPATEFRTHDLTWNIRAYKEDIQKQLMTTLIEKFGTEVAIQAFEKDPSSTSSNDVTGYFIKVKGKTLSEISKTGVSVPANWNKKEKPKPEDLNDAAYTAITTFMSVSSSKKIIMTGADPQLCKAIKDMIKDNVKYSEFKDLVIIDNVSKAVAAPTPPTTARGFKPMEPAPATPSDATPPPAPSLS